MEEDPETLYPAISHLLCDPKKVVLDLCRDLSTRTFIILLFIIMKEKLK